MKSTGCWPGKVLPLPQCHIFFFHILHCSVAMKGQCAYRKNSTVRLTPTLLFSSPEFSWLASHTDPPCSLLQTGPAISPKQASPQYLLQNPNLLSWESQSWFVRGLSSLRHQENHSSGNNQSQYTGRKGPAAEPVRRKCFRRERESSTDYRTSILADDAHTWDLQCWAIQCIWIHYNDLFSESLETTSKDFISRIYRNV